MSTGYRQARPRLSALKWLVLAAVVWSQLAFAVHQFDHLAADFGDTCAVCLKFDRDDDALVGAAPAGRTPATATAISTRADASAPTLGFSLYRARASP